MITTTQQEQRDKMKEWYEKNKENRKRIMRSWNHFHKEEQRLYKQKYYQQHKDYVKQKAKEYRNSHKKEIKRFQREYYLKNRTELNKKSSEYNKIWYRINQESYMKNKIAYENKRRKIDPIFRIKKLLRLRLWQAMNKYSQLGKVKKMDEYGIDYQKIVEKLMKELPSDFNTVKYHIDHIIPLCSFNLNDPEHIKKAFSPKNHQWLKAEDNLIKVSQDIKVKYNPSTSKLIKLNKIK